MRYLDIQRNSVNIYSAAGTQKNLHLYLIRACGIEHHVITTPTFWKLPDHFNKHNISHIIHRYCIATLPLP